VGAGEIPIFKKGFLQNDPTYLLIDPKFIVEIMRREEGVDKWRPNYM
jgi:hypothetical protein